LLRMVIGNASVKISKSLMSNQRKVFDQYLLRELWQNRKNSYHVDF
jgi:hypothetical protein